MRTMASRFKQKGTMKLLCNKHFKEEVVVVDGKGALLPGAKSQWGERVDPSDASRRSNNSVARDKRRIQGWVLEEDIKRLVGFAELLMGCHCNQCLKLLAKWDGVCGIQVLEMLDAHFSECSGVHSKTGVRAYPSALLQCLTGLRKTFEETIVPGRACQRCEAALSPSLA
jgi:hypothetical protein